MTTLRTLASAAWLLGMGAALVAASLFVEPVHFSLGRSLLGVGTLAVIVGFLRHEFGQEG